MGYLLDYELFQPCFNCGRTECDGNSCRRHPTLGYSPEVTLNPRPPRPSAVELIRRQELEELVERAVKAELDRREKGDTR